MDKFILSIFLLAVIICGLTDYISYRIPNKITLPIILIGIIYQIFNNNIKFMLIGLGISFFAGFFCWILGGLGGGDVKLMASIGTWLGANTFIYIFIYACIIAFIWTIFDRKKQGYTYRIILKKYIIEIKHLILKGFKKLDKNNSDLLKPIPFGTCLAFPTIVFIIHNIS